MAAEEMLHWKEGTSRASGVRGYAGYVGPNGREVGGSSVLGILAAAKRAGGGRREPFSPPSCRGARRPPSIDYTLPTKHSVLSATYEACACMHAYVRACVRACTRAHACLPGLVLKGSMYGEDVRAHSARGPTIV